MIQAEFARTVAELRGTARRTAAARTLHALLSVRRTARRVRVAGAVRLAAARAALRSYWSGGRRWRMAHYNGSSWRESYRAAGEARALLLALAVGAGLLLSLAIAL